MNMYLDIAKCPREQNHCQLRAILAVLADFFFFSTENKNVDKAIKIIILLKVPLVFLFSFSVLLNFTNACCWTEKCYRDMLLQCYKFITSIAYNV